MWQGFGSGGGYIGGFCEKTPGSPYVRQRQFQPAPKWTHHYTAEPINDAGGISVITHLRKGEEHCSSAVKEWSGKNVKQSGSVKECEEVLQASEQPMAEDRSGGPTTVEAEDRLGDNHFFKYYSYKTC